MLREMLRSNIGNDLIMNTALETGLAFSAGTDSLCILYVLLELGVKPTLYTYGVEGVYSRDLVRAEYISKKYNLELITVKISRDLTSAVADIKTLLSLGIRGTVRMQCCHGHLKIAPKVWEPIIFNGSGIDGIYGSYKNFAMAGAAGDKSVFDEMRIKHLKNPNDDAMLDQILIYKKFGNSKVIFPYRQNNVINYLMKRDYKTINSPKRKQIILNDFPEIFRTKGLYRPRGSQQLIAGTKNLHNRLLESLYNVKGRKRTKELYDDLAE